MRLKELTLCLLGLGLTGCASYGVQQHAAPKQAAAVSGLDVRTVNAVNAIYHTPSFDYRGQGSIGFKPELKNAGSIKPEVLEQALKLHIDQYIRAQRIPLNSKQKNELYQSMVKEIYGDGDDTIALVGEKINAYLDGLRFNYDGAVDYRQKLISYNPEIQYKKENLRIEAKLPLVLDLKQHRVYANYYSFLPHVADPKRKSDYVYADFSKYKDLIDQVDLKKLIAYFEQSSALPYTLAKPNQLQSVALTEAEKNAGIVEKVRLEMPIEDFVLQQQAFDTINKKFVIESLFNTEKIIETYAAQADLDQNEAEVDEDDTDFELRYYGEDFSPEEEAAYRASNKLYELIRSKAYAAEEASSEDEADTEAALEVAEDALETIEAEEAIEADSEAVVEETAPKFASAAMTADQCHALVENPKAAKMGDIQFCQYNYEIQILSKAEDESSLDFAWLLELIQGLEVFEQYQSSELQDAQSVAALWKKHSAEIEKIKPKKSLGRVINHVSMDAQGRAVNMDYQIELKIDKVGVLDFKFDMNVDHYGQAKSIDRNALKHAVAFTEVHPDSSVAQKAADLLGMPMQAPKPKAVPESVPSFDQQLENLANKIYDQTQSYSKTYEAVFALKLSLEQPQLFKQFNAQELNEIARVYAYSYADESVFNPQGKALDELNGLIKKHHLESSEQYDNALATSVDEVVLTVIEKAKERQAMQALVKKYKQPKAVFVQYYIAKFIEENGIEPEDQAQLQATAQRLAQTYVDARKKQLNLKSVQDFTEEDDGFIDHEIYRETFIKVMTHFK